MLLEDIIQVAKEKYPILKDINITVGLYESLDEQLKLYKGVDEDEGSYKIDISTSKGKQFTRDLFVIALSMIIEMIRTNKTINSEDLQEGTEVYDRLMEIQKDIQTDAQVYKKTTEYINEDRHNET